MEQKQKVYVLKEGEEFGGFWVRFGAYAVDLIPIIIGRAIVLFLVGLVFGLGLGWENGLGFQLNSLVSFLFIWIYHIYFLTNKSTTFGKSLFGLRVVDAITGEKVSLRQAVTRSLTYYVSSIFFGIGFIQIAFDKKLKRGLHDIIAKTLVVKDKSKKISVIVVIFAVLTVVVLTSIAFVQIKGWWDYKMGLYNSSLDAKGHSEFWMIDTKGNLFSLNISSGKVNLLATYPSQGPNSFNVIKKPEAGKFVYYKYEKSKDKWSIYVSDIFGESRKLIAQGFICADGPCDSRSPDFISIFALSPDGSALAYRKGEKLLMHYLEDNTEVEFPLTSEKDTFFSPDWEYLYNQGDFRLGVANLETGKSYIFSLDKLYVGTVSFSGDDSLVAISGRYNTSTAGAALVDMKSNKVIKQVELSNNSSKYDHVAWINNQEFVALFNNPKNKSVDVFVFHAVGGNVTYEKVYEGSDLKNPFAIDGENILLGSGAKEVISLNLKTKEAKVVYSYTGGVDDYFSVLGPVDSVSKSLIFSHVSLSTSSSPQNSQ